MRYVTFYEEYPIYEAAEGGYYYEGNEVSTYERLSRRKAKARMKEIWEECERENLENPDEYPWVRSFDGTEIWKSSRYIGEGKGYVIEKRLGSQVSGWHPYC